MAAALGVSRQAVEGLTISFDAFRRAAEKAALKKTDVEDIFCRNAERTIASASEKR